VGNTYLPREPRAPVGLLRGELRRPVSISSKNVRGAPPPHARDRGGATTTTADTALSALQSITTTVGNKETKKSYAFGATHTDLRVENTANAWVCAGVPTAKAALLCLALTRAHAPATTRVCRPPRSCGLRAFQPTAGRTPSSCLAGHGSACSRAHSRPPVVVSVRVCGCCCC
jgi:hypothetical protein